MCFLIHVGIISVLFTFGLAVSEEEFSIRRCVGETVDISCPPAGCTIQVVSAVNHHLPLPPDVCDTTRQHATCTTNATDVWGRCHRQVTCSLYVLQERPGSNCSSVSHFLSLRYRCKCPERCERLGPLPRGEITYSYTYIGEGTEATHTCHPGYHLVGPSVRMCEAGGKWNGIRPACSVPVSRCPTSTFGRQTYGDTCYELSAKGLSWEDAISYCSRANGTLARVNSRNELAFILWWLHQAHVYKYIWIDLEPLSELRHIREVSYTTEENSTTAPVINPRSTSTTTSYTTDLTSSSTSTSTTTTTTSPGVTTYVTVLPSGCYELYKNDSAPGGWLTRRSNCRFKSQFICEYESRKEENFFKEADNKFKNMAVGLGIGVGVAFVVIGLIVCLAATKPWKSSEPEGDTYDTVLDPHDERRTSCTDVTDPEMTYENGAPGEVRVESAHPMRTEEGLYDDVYYGTAAAPGREQRPAKIARKPVRKALGALNQYENVVVHNLTESLKRKLRPRMFRRESSNRRRKECACIPEEHPSSQQQKRQAPPPPGLKDESRSHKRSLPICDACGGSVPKPELGPKPDVTLSRNPPAGAEGAESRETDDVMNAAVIDVTDDVIPAVVHVNLNDVGHVNHRPADSVRAAAGAENLEHIMYRETNRNPQMSTEI